MGIILKKKKNGVRWRTLNRVTFCHWYRNFTSDNVGMPKGKDGKDCTSRRYWGADIDIATGTNDLLSYGLKCTSDNQTGLILKNAEAKKLGLDIDLEVCMSQTWAWHRALENEIRMD